MIIQTVIQLPLTEYAVGAGLAINGGALVGLAILRAEVKALRKQIENLEKYVLSNSKLRS
jgi:hypothetical protein